MPAYTLHSVHKSSFSLSLKQKTAKELNVITIILFKKVQEAQE